jgi:hypothetical protein
MHHPAPIPSAGLGPSPTGGGCLATPYHHQGYPRTTMAGQVLPTPSRGPEATAPTAPPSSVPPTPHASSQTARKTQGHSMSPCHIRLNMHRRKPVTTLGPAPNTPQQARDSRPEHSLLTPFLLTDTKRRLPLQPSLLQLHAGGAA